MNPVHQVGNATVTRIDELVLASRRLGELLPDFDGADEAASSIHSWLVRLDGRTILIDTAAGNAKSRPTMPILDNLDTAYLARLAEAGVAPEDIDIVLLTHLHADHVGWNTVLRDGRWVPTFPRALHVCSALEGRYQAAFDEGGIVDPPAHLGERIRSPAAGAYRDSVAPIIDAGLMRLIAVDGSEPVPGFGFIPTPGHSVDHASIRLRSGSEEALFTSDVMHHPIQVTRPELCSVYCEFPQAARRSRLALLAQAADSGAPCFTAHFGESSAGHVERRGDRFLWRFLP